MLSIYIYLCYSGNQNSTPYNTSGSIGCLKVSQPFQIKPAAECIHFTSIIDEVFLQQTHALLSS
jgi:hypothetical protein